MRSASDASERDRAVPERIRWAVEQLAVKPSDHVLEIGCGTGYAITLICAILRRGTLTAIDRSAIQVARASKRNSACVAAGRARNEPATLEDFAMGRRRFNKVFAVNVNAFWTKPAESLASVRRLLRPRGSLFLVYQPPSAARLRAVQTSLPKLLESHGFAVHAVRTQTFRVGSGLCIIGKLSRHATTASI